MPSEQESTRTSQWTCTLCGEEVGETYDLLPPSCPECENTRFRVPKNTKPRCPDCGSTNIHGERSHGDTICHDCRWYTTQGGPKTPVNWREINAE